MGQLSNKIETVSKSGNLYLKSENKQYSGCLNSVPKLDDIGLEFLALYRIDEITYEDESPRKEALENVIASMDIDGINFVYMIIGNQKGVSFYYGVAKNLLDDNGSKVAEINDIGEMILKPSLQGNFRGSVITKIKPNEKKKILKEIEGFSQTKLLEGIPGINNDDEAFQSVDRIIDVMLGNEFALLLIAKPIDLKEIENVQYRLYDFYNEVFTEAKTSIQTSNATTKTSTESKSNSKSKSNNTNHSDSTQKNEGETDVDSRNTDQRSSKSTSKSNTSNKSANQYSSSQSHGSEVSEKSEGDSHSKQTSKGTNVTVSDGTSKTETDNESSESSSQKSDNQTTTTLTEKSSKVAADLAKYIDEVVYPRLDYGRGKGLFVTSTVLLGQDPASLIKLENTIRSVYGGESGNFMPLKANKVKENVEACFKKLQIPFMNFKESLSPEEIGIRTSYSQFFANNSKVYMGNWMTSKELSLLAGLPQKEVVGLALREEVDFGLNVNQSSKDEIHIGNLVQSGVVLNGNNGAPDIPVYFSKKYFDKHIFVTGVTGSGKTTTCQKLLLESKENFLVIEPAKTEYRVLATSGMDDMLVFTLGKESGAPFRLNPFEFFEGEIITSRVDMIMASMVAAFDMEAAIPQVLETAIYKCYEDKGWDISTNKNKNNVRVFPTLSDLDKKIDVVVQEQGFDERLKNDYIGSIRARLKGLMVGSKGKMLNTSKSIDFVELLDKKVVLELENIKSVSEKSLIMGFVLANLSEAIKVKYNATQKPIEHITLIEEAHRLLSQFSPGDSLNKKQGVEMFSDMLAEVRKYGESLIIADQIPSKLTPEVLKNTNTKIVHKIFAQDDKEAIGNTMALKEEQKEHLSYLQSGRAIVMHPGLTKAIQVQILRTDANDTERVPPDDTELRNKALDYFASIYKTGILPGFENLSQQPTREMVEEYFEVFDAESKFVMDYKNLIHKMRRVVSEEFCNEVTMLIEKLGIDGLCDSVCAVCHSQYALQNHPEVRPAVKELLTDIKDSKELQYKLKQIPSVIDGSIIIQS